MSELAIIAVGAVAQILFSSRLILQWIVSEKNKKVLTPSLFWKLSLLASFLLFVYGYLQNDFSIMLGQRFNVFHLHQEFTTSRRMAKISCGHEMVFTHLSYHDRGLLL